MFYQYIVWLWQLQQKMFSYISKKYWLNIQKIYYVCCLLEMILFRHFFEDHCYFVYPVSAGRSLLHSTLGTLLACKLNMIVNLWWSGSCILAGKWSWRSNPPWSYWSIQVLYLSSIFMFEEFSVWRKRFKPPANASIMFPLCVGQVEC